MDIPIFTQISAPVVYPTCLYARPTGIPVTYFKRDVVNFAGFPHHVIKNINIEQFIGFTNQFLTNTENEPASTQLK